MTNRIIENVSDTALWVAMYRAMESERPDALFNDPYARQLAGAKGEDVLARMPKAKAMAWPMVVRTSVMDEILMRTISKADAVVNLAAGLDTRVWRLPLPPTLRWYDVDLPDMTESKRQAMAGETPGCRHEAVACDLSNATARRALFKRVREEAQQIFVISEGLLVYLDPEDVAHLAVDLREVADARWWMTDLATPKLIAMLERTWGDTLSAGAASFRFFPAESAGFFEPFGWRETEWRSAFQESVRLKRTFRFASFFLWLGKLSPRRKREEMARMSGITLLEPR